MRSTLLIACLLVLACACGNTHDTGDASPTEDAACPLPDAATFTCTPVTNADASACGEPQDCVGCDPNARYPVGCAATLPSATTFCGPLQCNCTQSAFTSDVPEWICPL